MNMIQFSQFLISNSSLEYSIASKQDVMGINVHRDEL